MSKFNVGDLVRIKDTYDVDIDEDHGNKPGAVFRVTRTQPDYVSGDPENWGIYDHYLELLESGPESEPETQTEDIERDLKTDPAYMLWIRNPLTGEWAIRNSSFYTAESVLNQYQKALRIYEGNETREPVILAVQEV